MADRYISREWLLKELGKYKDIREKWNTEVCDPEKGIGSTCYGITRYEAAAAAMKVRSKGW